MTDKETKLVTAEDIKARIKSLENNEEITIYGIGENDDWPVSMGLKKVYLFDGLVLYIGGVYGSECDNVIVDPIDMTLDEIADKCYQGLTEMANALCAGNKVELFMSEEPYELQDNDLEYDYYYDTTEGQIGIVERPSGSKKTRLWDVYNLKEGAYYGEIESYNGAVPTLDDIKDMVC